MTTKRSLFNRRTALPVKKVEASRAIFESEDTQRIDIRLTTTAGDKLTLELRADDAFRLITQLTVAYTAMRPPLPNTRSATGWGMQ